MAESLSHRAESLQDGQPEQVDVVALAVDARLRALREVVAALEDAYHPQNPSSMHPADYVTKRFALHGHEGLADV